MLLRHECVGVVEAGTGLALGDHLILSSIGKFDKRRLRQQHTAGALRRMTVQTGPGG